MIRRIVLYLVVILYATIESAHFGWNALPQSDAEVIADGIAILGIMLATR